MSLEYIPVAVVRTEKTHLGGGEYDEIEGQLPGSPFLARVYRDTQKVFDRDEAASGNASVDRMPRLSVRDPACPIREGDVALIPQPGGGTRRAVVLLVRPYGDRIQCDLEMGAEGDAGGIPGPLLNPPAPSAQAQIDALTAQIAAQTAQIEEFIMAYSPISTNIPSVPIAATVTLTLPAQDTRYPVNITANTVITLPAAPGNGRKLYFDFDSLSTFSCTFALNGSDTYITPLPPAITGASFALVSNAAGKWSIE